MRYFLFSAIGLSSLILSNTPALAVTENDKKIILHAAEEGQGEQYREAAASLHTEDKAVDFDAFNRNGCSSCHIK